MTSMEEVVDRLPKKGRGGDSIVGHLSPHDLVIPKEIQSPELMEFLHKRFSEEGGSLNRYVAGHEENSINPETGMPEFGWFHKLWNPIRDTVESVASLAGNYFLPGSSLVTDQLVSKGSQKQLGSTLGQLAQAGTGLAGAGVGSSITGIPSAASIGGGWTNAANTVGGLVGDATLGTDISSGISNAFSGVGDALGFGGSNAATGGASPAFTAGAGPSMTSPVASAVASAAPSGIDTGLLWDDASVTGNIGTSLSSPSSVNVGTGTVGSQNISNLTNLSSPVADAISGGTPNALASAAEQASGGGILDKIKTGAIDSLTKNPIGTALNAGGLAAAALKGNQPMAGENEIKAQAGQLGSQGAELGKYLESGTLPPGLQASINQSSEAAKATIRSQYASRGMSGSSAEQADLAAADQRAQAQGAQMALQLLNTGIGETGMSSGLYQLLLNESLQNDNDLRSAISSFASSFGGGTGAGGNTTINVGGAHG